MQGMTFKEIVASISENTEIDEKTVKAVLRDLSDLAAHEISEGYAFTVPGVAAIIPVYRPAKPKRKVVFAGIERMADPKPAVIRLRARPMPGLKKAVPSARSKRGKEMGAEFNKAKTKREKSARARARANRETGVGIKVFA